MREYTTAYSRVGVPVRYAICLLCSSFLFGLSPKLAAQDVDWRGVVLPGERKPTAYFPGLFAERTDTLTTATGATPMRRYYFNDPEGLTGNRLYTLTVVDYPRGSVPADSSARREAMFRETVDAAVESVAGTLLFASAKEQSRYPGYVFRVDYNEGTKSVYNEAYFVGDRYYHLQVFALKRDGGTKSRARFFDNFRPSPPPATEAEASRRG